MRAGWEALRARQRARFDAAAAVHCAAAGGGADAEAASARAGGHWGLRDRHGRPLAQAARDRHPAAAEWVAEWEGRMLLAWAMAGHRRLGAVASPRDVSDDLLRRVADRLLCS